MRKAKLKSFLDLKQHLLELKQMCLDSFAEEFSGGSWGEVWRVLTELQNKLKDHEQWKEVEFKDPKNFNNAVREIIEFKRGLEGKLKSDDSEAEILEDIDWVNLYNAVDELNRLLDGEYTNNTIFVLESDSYLTYRSFESLLETRSKRDKRIFEALPEISQSYLRDAGKCLVYGCPTACAILALQAVEASLRYYYRRHIFPFNSKAEWGPMLNDLRAQAQLPQPSGDCFDLLNELRGYYRNPILHGRASSEESMGIITSEKAKDIYDECWRALKRLMSSFDQEESPLSLKIVIPSDFDFDAALAAYLYRWNPEYPPFSHENVTFNSSEERLGQLVDSTVVYRSQLRYVLRPNRMGSLSGAMLSFMSMQENYSGTLANLVQYAEEQRTHSAELKLKEMNSDALELAQIFQLLKLIFQDSRTLLREAFKMLDKFFATTDFSPRSQRLIDELDLRGVLEQWQSQRAA